MYLTLFNVLGVSLAFLFGWLVGFLTSSSTNGLYRGRAPRLTPDDYKSGDTMTPVSAGHIIQTATQPQRGSNQGPRHQESRALPTELSPTTPLYTHLAFGLEVSRQDLDLVTLAQ